MYFMFYEASCKITDEGCKYLSKGCWKNLECIELQSNLISDEGLTHLYEAGWHSIKIINIGNKNST